MKKLTIILMLAIATQASAQNAGTENDTAVNTMQNGWYIEAAGQSLIGVTFNYERYFSKKPGGLSLHVGLGGGYMPNIFEDGITLFGAIPAGLSYNIPVSANKQHFIEVGVGYAYLFGGSGGDVSGGSLGSAIASYRYLSPSGKLQIRATLMPAVFLLGDGGGGPIPWIGFSIGRRF